MRLGFFLVTEYTLVMKCVKHLRLFAFILGVYSVSSSTAFSYPASRPSYSSLDSDSVQLTRSSRNEDADAPQTPSSKKKYLAEQANTTPLAPGTNNLSIGVGQVFLMGDLASQYQNALGTQVHYTYGVSDMFCFESDFGYSSHSPDSVSTASNFSLVNLNAGLRTNLVYFDKLIPYANIGLGFYRPSGTLPNSNVTLNAILFGMEFGGGVDLLLTKRVFFGTALTFHNMFDSMATASDGTLHSVGGSYISFMIHAGVTF